MMAKYPHWFKIGGLLWLAAASAPAQEAPSSAPATPLLEPVALPLIYPGFNLGERGPVAFAPVTQTPAPAWTREVEPPDISADKEAALLKGEQAAEGVLYLLHATQVNAAEQAVNTYVVAKILNVRGAQNTVRLAVPFNPAFEQLHFHSVTLEREGRQLDRLSGLSFRLYQKEDRAAELVYRGALQAVAFIPDLRPGDVLRYNYTVQGAHPLFNGRFDDILLLNVRGPREKRYLRVLSPAGRPLQARLQGGRAEEESRALPGGVLENTWTLQNLPVPSADDGLPGWFWPFPVVQLTQFSSWREVADMFAPLYVAPPGEDAARPLYQAALEKIRASGEDEEARIQAALDLVRDEVRYLSLSEGEGGFRPRAPEEVLSTRLGDCKDKTRLLCALLRDLGLEAYPALVSSRERAHLSELLPSPNAFDHVVVELRWHKKRYWLDATINQESRDFRRDYFPYFGRALVLAPETRELTPIGSEEQATRRVRVKKQYQINGAEAPAELRVTSVYTGAAAYQERELQLLSGKRAMDNLLLEANAARYDALMLGKPRSVKDDLARNQLTSVEEYVIPRVWQDPDGEGRNIAIFRASELPSMLINQVSSLPRQQPLEVEHPVHLTEEIEILSPIASEAQPKEYKIEAPAFKFTHQVKVEGTTLRLIYDYKSTSDFVPGDRTAEQLEKINEVVNLLAYSIKYPREFGGAAHPKTPKAQAARKPASSAQSRGGRGQPGVPLKR
jgi:transglutaminase-like putative cysteine protease